MEGGCREPARQRQLGRLEHLPADHAALMAACCAPVQPKLAPERAARLPAAHTARETVRPARDFLRRFALRFGSLAAHELGHRLPSLKLDSVNCHGSPLNVLSPSSGVTGSPIEPAELGCWSERCLTSGSELLPLLAPSDSTSAPS
jgi:hypothetical protein